MRVKEKKTIKDTVEKRRLILSTELKVLLQTLFFLTFFSNFSYIEQRMRDKN